MFAKNNRRERAGEAEIADDTPPVPVALSRLDGQELRLLLLEDEPGDVALAEEMLADSMPDYQWHVIDKPSMANALSVLRYVQFDVALVDLTLQDMRGVETVATLRSAAPNLPIVVYSGSGDLGLLQQALSNGAQFCIEKGTTMPKVVRAMIQCAMAPEATY